MWKYFAKIVSMGSLAGLIANKLRAVRINPPALRVLLAILAVMAYFLDSSTVVMIAGTWLIFLLIADAARLMGINLSLFLSTEKEKKEEKKEPEKDKEASLFHLAKHKTLEEAKPVKPASALAAGKGKNGGILSKLREEKKEPAAETTKPVEAVQAEQLLEAEPAAVASEPAEKSDADSIPDWMRVDKMAVSLLRGSSKVVGSALSGTGKVASSVLTGTGKAASSVLTGTGKAASSALSGTGKVVGSVLIGTGKVIGSVLSGSGRTVSSMLPASEKKEGEKDQKDLALFRKD